MDSNNKYTIMQKIYYENEGVTGNMNKMNHQNHNDNPDYWNILVSDVLNGKFKDKIGLDFGCGCGRNVMNLVKFFNRMDGVDIASELIKQSQKNLKTLGVINCNFYTCDGVSLDIIKNNTYDFIMSTIVLQHICIYEIRLNYLREFFRILNPGGLVSFQMGFGTSHPSTRDYFDNYYDAPGTNSNCDVRVTDPQQIINDLNNIGFVDIQYQIKNAWDDLHSQWIFIKATKP